MIGGAYEDGEETKSDFLARMFLMGRIEIDPENKTLKSNTTCQDEGAVKPVKELPPAPPVLENPILSCDAASCQQYSVLAKGFFSTYKESMQGWVLDGARSLIFEASECPDIQLEQSEAPVRNVANFMAEEWHHKYTVTFRVMADKDPKDFLAQYFETNVKQLEGEAAVKISHVQTDKVVV